MTDHSARIKALFDEQRARLKQYFRLRLSSCSDEAQELAQETYSRLIGPHKEVSDWNRRLWFIARNLANDTLAQLQIRRKANSLLQVDDEDPRTPESTWSEQQAAAAALRAIDDLPERQRRVLTRFREGCSFEQMARELGVHERTCRRDFERGIVEIQRMIGLERT